MLQRVGRALGVVLLLIVVPTSAAQDQAVPLGTPMPLMDQSFTSAQGEPVVLGSLRGAQGTLLLFWSNRCLWTERYQDRVRALVAAHQDSGIRIVLVNANDATSFEEEGAEESARQAQALGNVAYVLDAEADLAGALQASRTPHAFMFDGNGALVYEGTIDDSPGDPDNVSAAYLQEALNALVSGTPIGVPKTKAFGCTLKPKQG
ncbi:MAG: redoxin domain-containing protein [Bacteroidota bacterium]